MDFPRSCSSLPHIIPQWPVAPALSSCCLVMFPKKLFLACTCTWTQSKGDNPIPMGSAAFSCLTCTSRSRMKFGYLHNTASAAAAAGIWHLIPLRSYQPDFTGDKQDPSCGLLVGEEKGLLLPSLWVLELEAGGMIRHRLESEPWIGLGQGPALSMSWMGLSHSCYWVSLMACVSWDVCANWRF